MTPEEAQAFIRKIMGPPRRVLEGKEKEHVLLMLKLVEPFEETNNQHSWTACYKIGDREYHLHYFPEDDDPIAELLLPEEE